MIQVDSSVPRKNITREKRPFGWVELLFLLGLILYLATRFIALDKFPIYFFSDEAIQTELAGKLIENGFKDASGQIPVYFENGGQYNLSLSVWLQAWWHHLNAPSGSRGAFPRCSPSFFRSRLAWHCAISSR